MTINILFSINLIIEKCLLSWLKYLSYKLKKRYLFESASKINIHQKFDYWFHVSSEGELEQVIPFLRYLSHKKDSMLLIYTSPSVQKRVNSLITEGVIFHTMQFPIIDGTIINKLDLPLYLFMVRYDFFPRLLKVANHKDVNAVLLSATLKNKKLNFFNIFIWKSIYKSFDYIFWSLLPTDTQLKQLDINRKYIKNIEYDFRHAQIIERQKHRPKLNTIDGFEYFVDQLERISLNKRIILGSLWASELVELLGPIDSLVKKGFVIYIAPHHLKGTEYNTLIDYLNGHKINFCELTNFRNYKGESLIVSRIPGVLCEIYPLFKHAFVGGGHGRSVHSLLEPYWADCHIYCGPKVHRSTEYDFILKQSAKKITISHHLNGLEEVILKCDNDSTKIDVDTKESALQKSHKYILRFCDKDMDKKL